MKKLKLLLLVFTKAISLKYWLNYDFSSRNYIVILNKVSISDMKPSTVLFFNKELQLVSEDTYKVVNIDKEYLNKEIHNPIISAVYIYDNINYKFNCIIP